MDAAMLIVSQLDGCLFLFLMLLLFDALDDISEAGLLLQKGTHFID